MAVGSRPWYLLHNLSAALYNAGVVFCFLREGSPVVSYINTLPCGAMSVHIYVNMLGIILRANRYS